MLVILYGAIAEMGFKSREYLVQSGFQKIEKYNYTDGPHMTTQYGTRNYVSKEEFLENTDSLFRYEVGGIQVGFNEQQILDAVSGKTNCLLSLSTKDIAFLAEIKRIYADQVCLIYTYIDDTTLRNIIAGLKGITEDEATVRFETGCDVKQSYLKYKHIFDHVVIYGGETSLFDYQKLYHQFDSIIGGLTQKADDQTRYADVFISCTRKDTAIYEQLRSALVQKGITVFDDAQLPARTDWQRAISDAIQNAKIVVPVITENALSSVWVTHETNFALDSAQKNGTLIVPVLREGVNLDQAPGMKRRLELLSGITFEGDDIAVQAQKLADRLHKLLSAENNLKTLSKQVENYISLKMYDQAKRWQEEHLSLCNEIFEISKGTFVGLEACLLSQIKLISILMDMQLHEDALEQSVRALNLLDDGDTYDVLVNQFCICCAYLGMDMASVRELVLKRLGDAQVDHLLDCFANAKSVVSASGQTAGSEKKNRTEDESKIAQYGEMAIALFEEIIQDRSRSLSRHDLILGYERILNYCKHVGLKGQVAEKCISRIAELSSFAQTGEAGESSVATEALKIYLGQAIPKSGEYDVFLSYKSEDEVLAKKVYDYLSQSGKEVFFAKETLPQLGESEYEEMIFEAIDRARHMILIASNPDYLKTSWVKDEWSTFNNEIREGRKNGNLLLLLTDDIAADKGRLPGQLRQKEIVKMSEFRSRLLSYLR